MQRKVIADFPLVALALLLSIFGILMVYSAGQTDVPTVVARLYRSQIIWLAISIVAALLVSRLSVRFLEWVAWPSYLVTLIVLASLFLLGQRGRRCRELAQLADDWRPPHRPTVRACEDHGRADAGPGALQHP